MVWVIEQAFLLLNEKLSSYDWHLPRLSPYNSLSSITWDEINSKKCNYTALFALLLNVLVQFPRYLYLHFVIYITDKPKGISGDNESYRIVSMGGALPDFIFIVSFCKDRIYFDKDLCRVKWVYGEL